MQEVQHPLQADRQAVTKRSSVLLLAKQLVLDPEACTLLTSFLAIFGVVFLNLEVLKRFILPSQTDFVAFRVSLLSYCTVLPLQLTASGLPRGVRSL